MVVQKYNFKLRKSNRRPSQLTIASKKRMGSSVNTVKTVDIDLDARLSGLRYMCMISGLGCRLSFSFLAAGSPENFKSIDPMSQIREFSAA